MLFRSITRYLGNCGKVTKAPPSLQITQQVFSCFTRDLVRRTPHALRLTFHVFLLPARGEDRLHSLRLRIDGLILREAGLGAEGRHGLDELINLGIQ